MNRGHDGGRVLLLMRVGMVMMMMLMRRGDAVRAHSTARGMSMMRWRRLLVIIMLRVSELRVSDLRVIELKMSGTYRGGSGRRVNYMAGSGNRKPGRFCKIRLRYEALEATKCLKEVVSDRPSSRTLMSAPKLKENSP